MNNFIFKNWWIVKPKTITYNMIRDKKIHVTTVRREV